MSKKLLRRYEDRDRMNHWFIALMFILAGLSGLAFFHPSLFFFSYLFGGGSWARILHPFMGVLMVVAFASLAARLWRENVVTAADQEWKKHAGRMLRGDKAGMPPVGKYNAGQKGVFWGVCICLIVLLVTGVLFWQAWFADSVPIPLQRLAVVLHALAAFIISLLVVIHIYAALWVKGTVRAMTQGTVSAGWAKQHHYLWYKKVTGGSTDRT